MTWFDPTAQPLTTGGSPQVSTPEPSPAQVVEPALDATPEPAVNLGTNTTAQPAATGRHAATSETVEVAQPDTTGRHARVEVVDGRVRRRRLAAAAVIVAAAVAFLCWPRGDGYTPSLPGFSETASIESATTTPVGVEAAQLDQDAAAAVWSQNGSWDTFAPVSGTVTWITSGGTLVVFRSEEQCYVYGVVDGAPTTVQTQPIAACSTAAVGEAAAQLGQVAGTEVSVTTISADVQTDTGEPDGPTRQEGVVGTDAGSAAQVMYDVGREAQKWAERNATFEGFSSKKVVVMYATPDSVALTTDGATGCPAVLVDSKTITPTC